MNKIVMPLVGASVLAILFGIGSYFYTQNKSQEIAFLAQEKGELFIREHSPVLGSKDAKVYLIEFLDPECESCRAFAPFVKTLVNRYEGKIKLVVRYVPFHKNSAFAIKILEASKKQNKYWETLELLFKYQPYWGNHHNPRPELIWEMLPEVGVNIDQIREDIKNPELDKIIEQDFADAKALGVRATPGFFVNGQALTEFGYQQLQDLVESKIKEAYGE